MSAHQTNAVHAGGLSFGPRETNDFAIRSYYGGGVRLTY